MEKQKKQEEQMEIQRKQREEKEKKLESHRLFIHGALGEDNVFSATEKTNFLNKVGKVDFEVLLIALPHHNTLIGY